MFRFQLEVAIALVASAFSSLVIRYFNGKKAESTIQLPVHVEDDTLHDPFDVTRPEDVVHGYPIDAEGFWTSVSRRKIFISSLLALAVVISSILLGWSVADELWQESTVYFLHLVFALYLFLLAARSVRQDDAGIHTEYIIHLSSLSTFGFLLLGGTVILPESPPPFKTSDLAYKILWRRSTHDVSTQDFDVILRVLWYTLVSLHTFAWVLIIRTPLGPPLHYPASNIYSEKTVKSITNKDENNVCGVISGSPWDLLLFSYTTKVVWLGNTAESLEIGDLPILPADLRATFNYDTMRRAMRTVSLRFFSWNPKPGSGWQLLWKMIRLNSLVLIAEILLAATSALLFYSPAFFLRRLVAYLEVNPGREEKGWGWVYVIGLFASNATMFLVTGQLWSLSITTVQCRLRLQLNSTLFAKSLVRKDVASSAPQSGKGGKGDSEPGAGSEKKDDENNFSTKAQVMTLMTTDVDRVSDFSTHVFSLVDAPMEAVIGTLFLYDLLGVSCFIGLATLLPFIPLNHFAGKVVVAAQDNLMKARDERISLMNEVLGAIRMVKFMAWERSFEKRVLATREKELKYQQLNFVIEALLSVIWNGSPILVTLISFWHFAIVRQQSLTPSIAFTSILVFDEMKFALTALPETFISMLQSFVSLRRIEKYLNADEVKMVPPLDQQSKIMAFRSCTITWPQERSSASQVSSASSTPQQKFRLVDLNLDFPRGGLTLVCGKLGSGKTLLLLALLGEAEELAGQVLFPRSPPDSLASFVSVIPSGEYWIVDGLCAYVPQSAWLRNASIKENILFNLPYDEERYAKTLEVCALISDLEILEDGDESEIGERGVNLSGGQKARVSLARAVYSRASILLLDDVLSAVDAHTADHLYNECLKGKLMEGRTVILVSHHVRLCAPGASYIVALDNGCVQFHGSQDDFYKSGVIRTLIQSTQNEEKNDEAENVSAEKQASVAEKEDSGSTVVASVKQDKKPARKLIEEETRAVGRIGRDIWETYFWACGQVWHWVSFAVVLLLVSLSPVVENGWIRHWSNSELKGTVENPGYYVGVYAILTALGLFIGTIQWLILYRGSIRASHVLYRRLLETVLFTNIRFHDTISRGRLLNRFGKDFEGIDSSLSDNFGRAFMSALSATITIITISVVGGLPFIAITAVLAVAYWNVAKVYGQTSRDMRRLNSVTMSPVYSIYGETISGVTIVRAFGASSKFLRDMLRYVDTNSNPYYWLWGVNRWLSVRFNLLSSGIVGATGLVCLITPNVSAALAGFALAFASTVTMDLLFMVRRIVGLEQSMVAMERVKEYTDLQREPPEFMEPRPDPTWPLHGEIKCENLVIRYAPELPDVLHHINFDVRPGEKVGILGRTGSGKSTLAQSFFRFVEATEGRILIDGIDISTIGLADLRGRLTIIPQDPIILSGTLRSTLDVFDEYQDANIYEALRRVHLIPSDDTPESSEVSLNANVFKDLDSTVSEGGENFSTGEKQLLCMARAILKRSKVLVMDEATASVDYATDELIGRTIRHEFAESTILTIAHRLRTVIDYDRVLLLEQGRIVEFDKPSTLLRDPSSKFSALCKATGRNEYATLKQLAGISDQP